MSAETNYNPLASLTLPVTPPNGGTGVVNNSASTITISGNFATTLTLTGVTGVTLPTTGTLATLAGNETLSNKTLTAPKFVDLGFIADANGNELIIFDTVTSAVNEITYANAAASGMPTISTTGGDTNINLKHVFKGAGGLTFPAGTRANPTIRFDIANNSGGQNEIGICNYFQNVAALCYNGNSNFEWGAGGVIMKNSTGTNRILCETSQLVQGGTVTLDWSTQALANGTWSVTPVAGTLAGIAGTLTTNTTQTGNVGAGEDTLQTYSVPASTLSVNGHTFAFNCSGTIANTVNAKRIRVKFGATTIFDTGAAGIPISAAINWSIEGEIIRTGAATQKCVARMTTSNATLAAYCGYSTAAETLSGAVTFLVTGEAVSNDDIVKEMFKGYFQP